MGDEPAPRWWAEEGARPRPDPAGWWPEADTLHWVQAPEEAERRIDRGAGPAPPEASRTPPG